MAPAWAAFLRGDAAVNTGLNGTHFAKRFDNHCTQADAVRIRVFALFEDGVAVTAGVEEVGSDDGRPICRVQGLAAGRSRRLWRMPSPI